MTELVSEYTQREWLENLITGKQYSKACDQCLPNLFLLVYKKFLPSQCLCIGRRKPTIEEFTYANNVCGDLLTLRDYSECILIRNAYVNDTDVNCYSLALIHELMKTT